MEEQYTLTPVPLSLILQFYEEARKLGYAGSIWPFFDFFAPIEED